MFLVLTSLSRFAGRSSHTAKGFIAALLVATTSVVTIASLPRASALASTPSVTAPPPVTFTLNIANQEPGNFVISDFGESDTLLVSIGLVDPPTGTSFALPATTNLTAGFGYDFTGNKTQISFTGTQADANAALAAMTVTAGPGNGDVEIRVSASVSTTNVYFNPVNGHYYEYVSTPLTTDCKEGVGAQCITNIEDAIAPKSLFGAQGYWATISSEQENTFIANHMDAPNIAIGLSDRETEGTWRWLHGPEKGPAIFFNWAENEPNNYDGCGTPEDDPTCTPGEHYVVTNWQGAFGFWNDYGRPRFGDALSYIVEYSANCYSLNGEKCIAGTFSGSSQASASVTSTLGWGYARPAEFPSDLPEQHTATFYSVSCASPGNCTAVGEFQNLIPDSSTYAYTAITMTSTNGVWEAAQPAVFPNGVQSDSPFNVFNSVSCSSPGNCTAIGKFRNNRDIFEAFTMTSTNGVWELAQPAVFPSGVYSDLSPAFWASISCASPGNCTAAGQFDNIAGFREAFTMTSTNGAWELARPAVFAENVQYQTPLAGFNSVSCTSPGNCTAAGTFTNNSDSDQAFTMTSTNGVWELAQPAVFPDGVQSVFTESAFRSVSCASPGNCTVVGRFKNTSDRDEAFTMTSTNGVWELAQPAVFPTGVRSASPSAHFNSVSCASPGHCTAVGRFKNTSDRDEAFTMSLANGVWSFARPSEFSSGVRSAIADDSLDSVSCATPGNCTAVGYFKNSSDENEAFTMTSTNGVWELAQPAAFANGIQNASPSAYFNSVSCASPGNCTAVGEFMSSLPGISAFTATMTTETTPVPSNGWDVARPAEFPNGIFGYSEITVSSVSCATPGNCTVVGFFQHLTDGVQAFTMTSTDGVWAFARPALFPNGVQYAQPYGQLYSVSCATPGNCTAVGSFKNFSGDNEAFTMTSTNGVWGLAQPAAFANGVQNASPSARFTSVSCATPGNCTAVGWFENLSDDEEAFTMTSTNGVWALAQPAAFANGVQNASPRARFTSVSCATPGNCTTVGLFKNNEGSRDAITMTSTDGVWAFARPAVFPNGIQPISSLAQFDSVSCATPDNCTAAGRFNNISDRDEAFTMTSTNGVWALAQPAVFPDGVQSENKNDSFTSVSCAAPGNCTAVGRFAYSDGTQRVFTITSTNGVWALARPAAFPAGAQNDSPSDVFTSVSCASPGNCTAVGAFLNRNSKNEAFTMTSVDGEWELAQRAAFPSGVQSNDPPAYFTSVSCASPGNCTAVGDYVLWTNGAGALVTMSSKMSPVSSPTTTVAPTSTTSTTVASPTTTAAPTTTTTTAPTTTTTAAPTTTTVTLTTVASPTTTAATTPTTNVATSSPTFTTVASLSEAVTAKNVSAESVRTLPITGKDLGIAYFAMYILVIGVLILLVRKKTYY